MKKEIADVSDIGGKLRLEEAKGVKHFQFILLEYRFFEDGGEGNALPRNMPWIVSPLSLLLHIVKSRAFILIGLPCYFAKLESEVVGLFAAQEHVESLLVASLAVAKRFRRLGIGTYILGHIERIARYMGKRWLEVDVLRRNIPAQRFYAENGFTFVQSGRMRHLMRGRKLV